MYKSIIFLIAVFLFTGCDGSTPKIEETVPDNNTSLNSSFEFYNFAELGTIVGGDVTISSRDEQNVFYTTTTDENGTYPVNPIELLENIDNLVSERPKYILVTVQNGTDIDVNDDGIPDEDGGKTLYGKIKALYKLETITTQGGLVINLLSTPVAEILHKEEVLDDEKVSSVIKNIGAKDVNEDGQIDNKDIYNYRMVDDNSSLEDKLRTEYLQYIHDDDTVKIEEVTKELKQEFNIITYNYTISNEIASISLKKTNNESTIYYGLNLKDKEVLNEIYTSNITLNKNDYIVYKECINSKCSPINFLAFNGSEVKNYFIQSVESNIYEDVEYMNNLRKSINEKAEEVQNIEGTLEVKKEELEDIQKEIEELKEQIENNNEIINTEYL